MGIETILQSGEVILLGSNCRPAGEYNHCYYYSYYSYYY